MHPHAEPSLKKELLYLPAGCAFPPQPQGGAVQPPVFVHTFPGHFKWSLPTDAPSGWLPWPGLGLLHVTALLCVLTAPSGPHVGVSLPGIWGEGGFQCWS